jgi:hypothetical protein
MCEGVEDQRFQLDTIARVDIAMKPFIAPRRMLVFLALTVIHAAIALSARAALMALVNGDFEAQRVQYDANPNGYIMDGVTSWFDSARTGGDYNPFILSRMTPREGDSAATWPSADNTMIVGFAQYPGGYIYQQIGVYELGMAAIKVDFDAIRRQTSAYNTGFRPFEVQLWTGGTGTPADDAGLSTLGATKRAFAGFTAADIGAFVNNTPALAHVQVSLDPAGASPGDKLWLQIMGTGGNNYNNTYMDNIAISGGRVPSRAVVFILR